jgi:hypothetical protein
MTSLDALVGISVSDPGRTELEARGLTDDHVHHVFVELSRQILAAGGSLAYGGDLRHSGYTRTLIALLRTYSTADRPAKGRIHAYLAAPVWRRLSARDESELAVVATPEKVAPAGDDADGSAAARARAFTAMRRQMTSDVDARVVVGGRLSGQEGRWPGVVEEVFLALRAAKPLLVVGGLGGAAARVADAIRGSIPAELTTEFQRTNTDGCQALVDANVGVGEDELHAVLRGAELRNGLSRGENTTLFEATDLDLIVALVMRGLRAQRSG